MKKINMRILSLLLAVLMLLSLSACGKEEAADPNLLKIGPYELRYKSAKIMQDYDGNDAIVLTLDYTNNSKETTTYLWSFIETATQNGTELESATIFLSEDSFDTVTDSQFTEVAPGETLEVQTAYVLADTTGEVEVASEELFGSKSGKFTIDPATLSRETTDSGSAEPSPDDGTAAADISAAEGDPLLEWWNGDWYGWWTMYDCSESYEDLDGMWWDAGAVVDISEDKTGTILIWDEDYPKDSPMSEVSVTLNEEGTGEYGTLISEDGYFTDQYVEHADWIIDPGLVNYPDMICIEGYYENGEDSFYYDIYLRPWGTYWDDMAEEDRPYYYDSWYLPLIEAGEPMPDVLGEGAQAPDGDTGALAGNADEGIPSGDGIITNEQVEKGYVYMSEVAKDIFNTTYEELAAYFGVDGQFDKEEYSDVYGANMRFYKWISSENPHNFIYVNFLEEEPGVYKISAFNTSGISGSEAIDKYLEIVKAEEAERDREAAADAVMKELTLEVTQFAQDDVKVTILTSIPESGWSNTEDTLVENEDPDAFGAGVIRFEVRAAVADFDFYKDQFENYQDIDDRVIGGITFQGRTYEYIGYDWIEYVAQIDDTRALSIGLTDLDCFEGTMPDIILNNMQFQ